MPTNFYSSSVCAFHHARFAGTCRNPCRIAHAVTSDGQRSSGTTRMQSSLAIFSLPSRRPSAKSTFFFVVHHGTRRLLHLNVTTQPTAAWTLQQLREAIGFEDSCRYLLHDRDSIFAGCLDRSIEALGLRVLKSPLHSPKANAICERLIGTIRRECLDWHIPVSEGHMRCIGKAWADHYHRGRPHMSLGPGLPDPPTNSAATTSISRHHVGAPLRVSVKSVLGGLHHEYALLSAGA